MTPADTPLGPRELVALRLRADGSADAWLAGGETLVLASARDAEDAAAETTLDEVLSALIPNLPPDRAAWPIGTKYHRFEIPDAAGGRPRIEFRRADA